MSRPGNYSVCLVMGEYKLLVILNLVVQKSVLSVYVQVELKLSDLLQPLASFLTFMIIGGFIQLLSKRDIKIIDWSLKCLYKEA